MLRKLIKYEFRCTSRYLGVLLAVFAGFSLLYIGIAKLYSDISENIFTLLLFILANAGYMLLIYAAYYTAYFYSVYRFYKNLVTDEGYLMHTLPATPAQLVLSKLIVALTWNTAAALCTAAAIFIIGFGAASADSVDSGSFELILPEGLAPAYLAVIVIISVILLIASTAFSLLMVYYSIALGQTKNSRRALWSFAIYMLVNFISSLILMAAAVFVVLISAAVAAIAESPVIMVIVLLAVITIILSAICLVLYHMTCGVFRKRLNLI